MNQSRVPSLKLKAPGQCERITLQDQTCLSLEVVCVCVCVCVSVCVCVCVSHSVPLIVGGLGAAHVIITSEIP